MLVLEPDADDEADEQPLSLVPAAEDPRHEVDDRHPDEHVERRRREEMADRHRRAGRRSRERGHRLARTSRAELPCDQRDEHDDERDRDGGDNAQPARVSPNSHSEKRPSSGVSAGWSSYPQAGCRAATRK